MRRRPSVATTVPAFTSIEPVEDVPGLVSGGGGDGLADHLLELPAGDLEARECAKLRRRDELLMPDSDISVLFAMSEIRIQLDVSSSTMRNSESHLRMKSLSRRALIARC